MGNSFDVNRIEKILSKVLQIYKSGINDDEDAISKMISSLNHLKTTELKEDELEEVTAAAGSPNYKRLLEIIKKNNSDR